MAPQNATFEIGLAMAGAISAGAYSAGVLDFLFQALDAWEQQKRLDPVSVPSHNVCIKVIAGASAGAIAGALSAAALAAGLDPTPNPGHTSPPPTAQPFRYVLPALYAAWVTKPDMASVSGGLDLLDTGDLAEGEPIVSLLNSTLLDTIGDTALRIPNPPNGNPPIFGPQRGGTPIPYIAEKLHVYMTISNMRGVPYKISFSNSGQIRGYGMLSHGDRTHYAISGLGSSKRTSEWASNDPSKAIDVKTLPTSSATMPPEWQDYLQAALASSAFPIGFAPRQIDRGTNDYKNRMWPFPRNATHEIVPDWPTPWCPPGAERSYSFANIDGGLIDNDPFEYAHFALLDPGTTENERAAELADRAVILVSPFPQDPHFETDDTKLDRSILSLIKSILPLMIDQARFKPTELALALDESIYSRFLIAPRRADSHGDPMKYTIATGLLGGFGGFLDQALRDFDYQLGRRNCQKFLRDAFALDSKNPIFSNSADGSIPGWSAAAKDHLGFRSKDTTDKAFFAIVPLVGSAAPEVPLPQWPRLGAARLMQIEGRILARAKVLVPRLIEQQIGNRLFRTAANVLWHVFGVGKLKDYVHLAIQQDLIRRDQHADWQLASDDERNVFAALSDPAYGYRTVDGIVAATGVKPDMVETIFAYHENLIYVAPKLAPNGADAYTLASRKGNWFSRNIGSLFNKPAIG